MMAPVPLQPQAPVNQVGPPPNQSFNVGVNGQSPQYNPSNPYQSATTAPGIGRYTAPSSSQFQHGLNDWQKNYVDARRPNDGAITSQMYDQSQQMRFQNFNNQYGSDFTPYAYRPRGIGPDGGGGGYDPRSADVFSGAGIGNYIQGQNTMDEYGNATVDRQLNRFTGNADQSRYLPTIDPIMNGAIDSSYLPEVDPSVNPEAYNPSRTLTSGQGDPQKNLVSLMARNYLSLKPYYPELTFQAYVDMYQKNVQSKTPGYTGPTNARANLGR